MTVQMGSNPGETVLCLTLQGGVQRVNRVGVGGVLLYNIAREIEFLAW